jgi:tetratricopeptide (TPR) repeat protein
MLLRGVGDMGTLYYRHGNYCQAVLIFEWVLDWEEKTLGKDHPSTLTTVNNMALVFDNQGQYDKAMELYERALDGREKALGKDHPDTLTTVHNMASAFESQEQYAEALELCRRAIGGTISTSEEGDAQIRKILRLMEQLQSKIDNPSRKRFSNLHHRYSKPSVSSSTNLRMHPLTKEPSIFRWYTNWAFGSLIEQEGLGRGVT